MSQAQAEQTKILDDQLPGSQTDDTAQPAGDDIEGRARRMGWKPLDEFRGDRNKWVDANTFIQTGEQELPVLKDRLRRQDRLLQDSERSLQEQSQVLKEMREYARRSEERAYKKARDELERQRVMAVQEGNVSEFQRTEQEIKDLEKDRVAPPPAPTAPAPDPHVQQFLQENSWFHTDETLKRFAISTEQSFAHLPMKERLDEVARRTRLAFPEKFQQQPAQTQQDAPQNARRAAPAPVAGATPAPSRGNQRTFANLPPEAKAAFQRWKRQMPDYKEEEYVANYDWES